MGIVSALRSTSSFQVSEGPPLRLWRATTEVPASPEEILKRLLKEQHLWDLDLLDSKVIEIDLDYGEGSELEARGRQRLSNNLGTAAAPGSTRRRCAFGSEPLSLDA